MQILYNARTDLLYLRLDNRKQQVINQRLSKDIVLDLGEDNRIVGIVTHTDIVRASPSMISLLGERLKMRKYETTIPTREARVRIGGRAGICESCGKYSAELDISDEEWCCDKCFAGKHETHQERKRPGFKDWSRMG